MIYRDVDGSVARLRNLCIVRIGGRPSVPHIRAMGMAYKECIAEYPEGVVLLAICAPTLSMAHFSEDVRAAILHLARTTKEGSIGSAFVISGDGLLTSALRALVSGVFLVAKSNEPYRMFPTVAAASEWVSEIASVSAPMRPSEIADAATELA